ncbi:hypothetical protein ACFWM0_25075 [Streptomyces sp. NPDC058405]
MRSATGDRLLLLCLSAVEIADEQLEVVDRQGIDTIGRNVKDLGEES